jgi:hypothetical protein
MTPNERRAEWAQCAIDAFIETTGTDPEDALSDLLCDIMHWCDIAENESPGFDAELDRAKGHYEYEVVEDGDG